MLRFVTDRIQRYRDQIRRRLAIWRWDRPNNSSGPFVQRVVFVRWDAKLGDTIVLSWVWRELKRQRPDLEITVITSPAFEDMFRHGYGIDSVYLASKRNGWAELRQIAKAIRKSRYLVHLGVAWRPRDIFFARQVQPQHIVGLDDELAMVDIKLGQSTRAQHFSEKLIPWLEQLGVDTTDRHYWVPRSTEAAQRVKQWWPTNGEVIGLCPYGASRKKHLNEQFVTLIVDEALRLSLNVVLLIAPAHRHIVADLIQRKKWQAHVSFNRSESTQYDLFEQVARCKAIVTVDTAVVHIADGLGKPLLAIYNSTGIEFDSWCPSDPRAIIVRTIPGQDVSINALEPDDLKRALVALAERIAVPGAN